MKLSATHAFNYIVLRVKFGLTSYEAIPPALIIVCLLLNGTLTCLHWSPGVIT